MIHLVKVLARQLQFIYREVWGAHSLIQCIDGDGVDTAWLWKTLKGAVVLCCSVSLTTLKCISISAELLLL